MSFTNYLENKLLDLAYGGTSFTPSGTLYLGLSTTTPAEDGTSFTEPAIASGYARKAITNNKFNWSNSAQVGTSGEIHNLSGITFGNASGNWGTLTYFGLFNSAAGGNLLNYGALTVPKSPTSGDSISLQSGAISVRLD